MRRLAPAILLIATAACSRGFKRADAEAALQARYPAIVPVEVPGRVSAAAGSPEAQRAQVFMDNLQKTDWFDITKKEEDGKAVYTFSAKDGTPVRSGPHGWLVPAAQALFVKATGHAENGHTVKVTYQIKLANPTAQFPLFELLYPKVRIGDTKPRHAVFEKQGGSWVLTGTDESFVKAD